MIKSKKFAKLARIAAVPARTTSIVQSGGAQQFMYTVYVLQDKNGKFYKGLTSNLARRFSEHVAGGTKTTRKMENLRIVYTEEYLTVGEARSREVYLKTAAGRRFLKTKLRL